MTSCIYSRPILFLTSWNNSIGPIVMPWAKRNYIWTRFSARLPLNVLNFLIFRTFYVGQIMLRGGLREFSVQHAHREQSYQMRIWGMFRAMACRLKHRVCFSGTVLLTTSHHLLRQWFGAEHQVTNHGLMISQFTNAYVDLKFFIYHWDSCFH